MRVSSELLKPHGFLWQEIKSPLKTKTLFTDLVNKLKQEFQRNYSNPRSALSSQTLPAAKLQNCQGQDERISKKEAVNHG